MAQVSKQKLWGGRFTGKTDPLMHQFNESLSYDRRLYKADILGSKAYALALHSSGIISSIQLDQIRDGLDSVLREWQEGTFVVHPEDDEDIHTANERRLGELIDKNAAGRLHTGRSRNDQVATDMRLWLLDELATLRSSVVALVGVMVSRAEKEVEALMPGYTHLQRAQPIRWSHLLLNHATAFLSDLSRLDDLAKRVSVLPLGSGPLAGNPFGVDRELLRKELGFRDVSINSMHAVSDRDFVAEFLWWASMTMIHVSRIAEDLVIYSSAEFGFVSLSDAYSTGSSIMPQKKNPDSLELLRGKSGRTFGQLSGFMMTLKGLPSTYNKDLQEDKEPMFDAADTLSKSVRILEGVVSTLTIHPEKMRAALTPDMLATDLAEYLVRKQVPFRETHHISGRCVRLAEDRRVPLSDLTVDDLRSVDPRFGDDILDVWRFEASVERRDVVGGTARKSVLEQVERIRKGLA